LAGSVITADKTGTVISAVVVLSVAVLALVRTRIGLGVRALTQNNEGAALVGIDLRTTAFAILAVSGALAGLASTLLAQTFYVVPDAGYVPLVKGLWSPCSMASAASGHDHGRFSWRRRSDDRDVHRAGVGARDPLPADCRRPARPASRPGRGAGAAVLDRRPSPSPTRQCGSGRR
jgi:hypothetical protein